MSFLPMIDLISKAYENGFAVPSFCGWNGESIKAILETAQELEAPVIVMNGPPEYALFSPQEFASIAFELKRHYSIPASLLLDHGDSMDRVRECADAGYTSVMLDYSTKPFHENTEALRALCGEMHPRNITVEGEIGTVGHEGVEIPDSHDSALTDVEEARRFVNDTGIDIVAVSIGNVHGVYSGKPDLQFELLKAIRDAVHIPIALHGSSGLSEKDIQNGVALGIGKVNVATELVQSVRSSLLEQWTPESKAWLPTTLAEAYSRMKPVLAKWIRMTGAAGKASIIAH